MEIFKSPSSSDHNFHTYVPVQRILIMVQIKKMVFQASHWNELINQSLSSACME